jgi:hypothetical protein
MTVKTMSGDDQGSATGVRHGDLTSAYKSSYAKYCGAVESTQQSAAGVGLGTDTDKGFSTSDYNDSDTGSDTSGYGKGIAGEMPMVARSAGGDFQSDTGQSGGRPVG